MFWEPLRKTTTFVRVALEHHTDTLLAEKVRFREHDDSPGIDLSLDLNKSLRTRSKQSNTFIDARRLADGDITNVRAVTVDDNQVIDRIGSKLAQMESVPTRWRLHIALEGDHWFLVRPDYKKAHAHQSLTLHVVSRVIEDSERPR